MFGDEDGFDGEPPEELKAWFESRKKESEFKFYILVNGKVKTANIFEFGQWFAETSNSIDRTNIGDVLVSTVFLGIDHSFEFIENWNENKPILFETMVFGGKMDQYLRRWSSFGEAKRGHYEIVDAIRNNREPNEIGGTHSLLQDFLDMFRDEFNEEDTNKSEDDE